MAARRSSNEAQSAGRRDQILAYLAQRGGRIESASGVGLTAAIADAVGYGDIGVLNGMLARLEQQGAIRREIRGRRTFAIELGDGAARRGRSAPRSAPPARTNGRARSSGGGTPFVEAAGALVDQLAGLRGTIEELASRVAALESRGTAAATTAAPARRSTAKRGTAKRGTAKRATAKRGSTKRATAKRGAAKRATAKRGATKRGAAKRATAARTATTRTTAKRAGAKRGTTKKAASKRAPARASARGGASNAAVRSWARANGYAVNDRGRLPREVVDAYRKAR